MGFFENTEKQTIIYITPILIAFGLLTNNPSYYEPCSINSKVYFWSYLTFLFAAFNVFSALVFVQIFEFLKIKIDNNLIQRILQYLISFLRLVVVISNLISCFGLFYSYITSSESCGYLNILVFSFRFYYYCFTIFNNFGNFNWTFV